MRPAAPIAALATLIACLAGGPAHAAERRALLVGANTGWAQDQPLRHAVEDAHRVARTLVELGDFAPKDVIVLEDPSTAELRARLETLAKGTAPGDGSLVVFYFSGHADDRHLHLQGPPLAFEELSNRLRALPAAVKLGVLDACRSGAILTKGGRPTRAFEVKVQDELTVRGLALLASSGADELSQEARALSGSFFTHHLVSGLRGAADEDDDGRVSLGEAYRYASLRTTLDTAATPAGVQRPAFRYELNGRGEVFLTRRQSASGALRFAAGGARCFVTDVAERRLVAEVFPEPARAVAVAVPAGEYVVKCPEATRFRAAGVTVTAGAVVDVDALAFRELPLAAGVLKGGPADPTSRWDAQKRAGFQALRDDRPDEALASFDAVLRARPRDPEAFRGKALAYLALRDRAAATGDERAAKRWLDLALRTDPSLEGDPEIEARLAVGRPPPPPPDPDREAREAAARAKRNLESGHPRDYQRVGLGLSLVDAHGLFSFSGDWLPRRQVQLSVRFSPLSLAAGAQLRFVPFDGPWSPFAGVGGQLGARVFGAGGSLTGTYSLNGQPFATSADFERVAYLDAGVQLVSRSWQLDLGLAVGWSAPVDAAAHPLVMPVLTIKFMP